MRHHHPSAPPFPDPCILFEDLLEMEGKKKSPPGSPRPMPMRFGMTSRNRGPGAGDTGSPEGPRRSAKMLLLRVRVEPLGLHAHSDGVCSLQQ